MFLDDDFDKFAKPREGYNGLGGLLRRSKVAHSAQGKLNVPLGHGLWLLLKKSVEYSAKVCRNVGLRQGWKRCRQLALSSRQIETVIIVGQIRAFYLPLA